MFWRTFGNKRLSAFEHFHQFPHFACHARTKCHKNIKNHWKCLYIYFYIYLKHIKYFYIYFTSAENKKQFPFWASRYDTIDFSFNITNATSKKKRNSTYPRNLHFSLNVEACTKSHNHHNYVDSTISPLCEKVQRWITGYGMTNAEYVPVRERVSTSNQNRGRKCAACPPCEQKQFDDDWVFVAQWWIASELNQLSWQRRGSNFRDRRQSQYRENSTRIRTVRIGLVTRSGKMSAEPQTARRRLFSWWDVGSLDALTDFARGTYGSVQSTWHSTWHFRERRALRRMEIRCHFGFSKLSTRATSCRDRWTMAKVVLACRWC